MKTQTKCELTCLLYLKEDIIMTVYERPNINYVW